MLMVGGLWSMVCGSWFMIYGLWSWCIVHGPGKESGYVTSETHHKNVPTQKLEVGPTHSRARAIHHENGPLQAYLTHKKLPPSPRFAVRS